MSFNICIFIPGVSYSVIMLFIYLQAVNLFFTSYNPVLNTVPVRTSFMRPVLRVKNQKPKQKPTQLAFPRGSAILTSKRLERQLSHIKHVTDIKSIYSVELCIYLMIVKIFTSTTCDLSIHFCCTVDFLFFSFFNLTSTC